MSAKGSNLPADDTKLANLDPTDSVTNEEAVPVTLFAGTRLVALQWIMEPVNQFTKDAPDAASKKG